MALATLSIDIEARLATFEASMGKAARIAEKNAEASRASWARASASIASVAGGIAGAFAGFSLVQFVQSNVDALDALNDVADATGASIENISALEDVARRTGTGMDTVSTALVKFNRELADTKADSPTAQALKAIGLSAEELRKLDPAEALLKTAQALSTFADDGNKARLIQELFGKSVKEIAPYLKDLGEQGKLNATATKEQAEAAEKFNKQLATFQTNIGNAARGIVSEFLPAVNNMFDRIKQDGGFFAAFWKDLQIGSAAGDAKRLGADLAAAMAKLERVSAGPETSFQKVRVAELRGEITQLQLASAKANEQVKALLGAGKPSGAGVTPTKPTVGVLTPAKPVSAAKPAKPDKLELFGPEVPEAVKRMQQALDNVDSAKVRALREELQALISVRAAGGGGAVDEALLKVEQELEKYSPAAHAAAEAHQRLNGLLDATDGAKLAEARADMQLLADAFERGTITAEQFSEAASARLGLGKAIKPQIEEMDKMLEQFGRNIQDSLGSTIKSTLKGDFDDIGKLWGDMLLDMISQAAAARIGKELFGDLFSGGELGGGIGALVKAGAGLFGAPGFAAGGDHAGGWRVVGENGPELEATGPARIYNAGQTAQIFRGGGSGGGQGGGKSVSLNYAPVYQIDSRSDRAQVLQDCQALTRQGQREMVSMLKAKGVM